MTYICVDKLTIIGSDNGLSHGRRQAIIWTNAGILLIGPLVTNFSEIFIEIYTFSLRKMYLKMSSGKWRPFWLGLNVIIKGLYLPSVMTSDRHISWSLEAAILDAIIIVSLRNFPGMPAAQFRSDWKSFNPNPGHTTFYRLMNGRPAGHQTYRRKVSGHRLGKPLPLPKKIMIGHRDKHQFCSGGRRQK